MMYIFIWYILHILDVHTFFYIHWSNLTQFEFLKILYSLYIGKKGVSFCEGKYLTIFNSWATTY
jgi:hypothetical protein